MHRGVVLIAAGILLLGVLAGWIGLASGMISDPQEAATPTAISMAASSPPGLTATLAHVAATATSPSHIRPAPTTVAYSTPVLPQSTSTRRPTPTHRPTSVRVPTEPVATPITATFSSVPPDPFQDEIRDYAFVGTQNIWIVVHHALLHTADRGQHWTEQYGHGVDYVAFADKDHGWIIADNTIVGTQDGGRTWRPQYNVSTPANPPYYVTKAGEINSLVSTSAQRAWASTSAGLVATTDGGTHWARVNSNKWVIGLRFTDELHGWGFAGGGAEDPLLSHSTDGGITWQTWKDGPGCNWYKSGARFAFTGADTAWAVCIPTPGAQYVDPMYLQKATNGGQTWQVVYSTEPNRGVGPSSPYAIASVGGLFFLNEDKGWVSTLTRSFDMSSQTTVRTTQDGGRSWNTLAGFDYGLYDMRFGSATVGYGLTGDAMLGTTDGGGTWAQLYGRPIAPRHFTFFDAHSGVGLSTIADLGAVVRTTDSGNTWRATGSLKGSCRQGVISRVLDISFPNSHNGWVLLDCRDRQGDGQQRELVRTTDGGATWNPEQKRDLPTEPQGRGGSVSFVDTQTGYIVDLIDSLQVTHDGGVTFTKLPTKLPNTYPDEPAIDFVTANRGWLAGDGTWATTDGGILWQRTFAGNVDHPVFDMLPDGHIWISNLLFTGVSNYSTCGLLSKAANSAKWTALRLAVCPEEISFADDLHGWMRDTRNYLYSTNDGGQSWVMLP